MLVLGSMENSAVVLAFLLTKVRARPFHKTSPFTDITSFLTFLAIYIP